MHIILIEGDKVLWYNGLADPTKPPLPTLTETDFSNEGIRRVLLQRNKNLFLEIEEMNKDVTEGKLEIPQGFCCITPKKDDDRRYKRSGCSYKSG